MHNEQHLPAKCGRVLFFADVIFIKEKSKISQKGVDKLVGL
jgi:hypothetical protein